EGRPRSPGIPSNQNPPGRLLLAGAMRAKLLCSITWLSRARVQTRILRPSGMESAGCHPTARRGPVACGEVGIVVKVSLAAVVFKLVPANQQPTPAGKFGERRTRAKMTWVMRAPVSESQNLNR